MCQQWSNVFLALTHPYLDHPLIWSAFVYYINVYNTHSWYHLVKWPKLEGWHCINLSSCQQNYITNTLRPRENDRHFADDNLKCIFLNENVWISIKISLKFVPKSPINNILALVQLRAWYLPGDKPLSEPLVVRLLMHIRHSASMSWYIT